MPTLKTVFGYPVLTILFVVGVQRYPTLGWQPVLAILCVPQNFK